MLDTGFHQGASLHSFTPDTQLRVLGVASQENASSGLETLWQICASLQRLGYPVVVLDATAVETADAPGLVHLLKQAPWHDGIGLEVGATSSLAVIPAAKGLIQLNRQAKAEGSPPLQDLLAHFRAYGLVVLHAPAPLLGALLTHTVTRPLLVMENGSSGMLESYKSMKQIAMQCGLSCTVAAVVRGANAKQHQKTRSTLDALQDCAQRHLGGEVRTTTIAAENPQDIQRLALQLLENAGTIDGPLNTLLPSHMLSSTPAQFVRSH